MVVALQLMNKVRIALKESGGASSDYQEEIVFLQSLYLTIKHIDKLETESLDPELVDTLRAHTRRISEPLRTFTLDIKRSFDSRLGAKNTRFNPISAFRKVEWAVRTSEKVKSLRQKISLPLTAILAITNQLILLVYYIFSTNS